MYKRFYVGAVSASAILACGSAIYAQEVTTYHYDALGRLKSSTISGGPSSGVTTAINHDPASNRTSYSVTGVPTPTPTPTPGASGAVVNYSFEEPWVSGALQYNPVVSGAFFQGSAGVAANGSAWSFPNTSVGSQVGFVQDAGSSITLNVSGLTIGATYRVRFKMAKSVPYNANSVFVSFQSNGLGSHVPSAAAFQEVVTTSFVATSSVGALTFAGEIGGGTGTAIDDVRITSP